MSLDRVIPSVATYSLLGRSGLRVSPLCLGTMTFGTEWGWGSPEETARAIFSRYLSAGGNFIDTADGYTGGTSERLIGQFVRELGCREAVVLATKFTFNTSLNPGGTKQHSGLGDPNGGGNGRKNIIRACEDSLRRLGTDYIDLYWLHNWDGMTPVEEVMYALDSLVRSGKVRYLGFSNVPAWYLGRAQTLAEWRGYERIIALQYEYSLVERNIEKEFVPAALALGLGICPWSPLGGGVLSGKYRRADQGSIAGEGRLQAMRGAPNPVFDKLTDRNLAVAEVVHEVAQSVGRTPAQVALNWVCTQPGVTSSIIGASKLAQLEDNLSALDFTIPDALRVRLSDASRLPTEYPYVFYSEALQGMVRAGTNVLPEPRTFRPRIT